MVDADDVRRVAENSRIEVEEDEAEELADEFENILEMFETLDRVDTEEVEPAFHPIEVEPETREDEVGETLNQGDVFRNTENEEDGFFKGPSA